MTSASKEVPPTAPDTISHPSGALKILGTPNFPELHIWFPDCQHCHCGIIFRSYHWNAPGGECRQCAQCYYRYFQWLKEHQLIRYVVSRSNYPVKLKIDSSKNLEKSDGRHFYHEVDYYARTCEAARVDAYALDAEGKRQEHLSIGGTLCKSFPTLASA